MFRMILICLTIFLTPANAATFHVTGFFNETPFPGQSFKGTIEIVGKDVVAGDIAITSVDGRFSQLFAQGPAGFDEYGYVHFVGLRNDVKPSFEFNLYFRTGTFTPLELSTFVPGALYEAFYYNLAQVPCCSSLGHRGSGEVAAIETPLPAALPLFVTGVGFIAFLTRRRREAKTAGSV